MLVAGARLASPAKCTLTQNSNTIFLVRNALLLMLHDQLNLQQEANKAAIDSLEQCKQLITWDIQGHQL